MVAAHPDDEVLGCGGYIAEVKSSGESIKLRPMNAFERKVVHDTIQELGLTSESEGEDPDRCVVVLPA